MSEIIGVTLYILCKDLYDRRGVIATFRLLDAPNREWVETRALEVIWRMTSLLSDNYHAKKWEDLGWKGYCAEGNECWVNPQHGENEIVVRHKYWTDAQVEAFRAIVRSMAALHGWEVSDEAG